ncbi:helicase-associated domain-containing protein [Pseudarthrobacter sp. J1763]|uniref:helicase-associated domain-containing protein n=1 Tax=Pseudarthrobacter sp. J1763 TaxID=3420445 RepID=UPI003D29A508
MSSILLLREQLAARSDLELRALFTERPDLISPTVPDFAALAARACARVSVQRALERLNRPQLQVLETLYLITNTDTGHGASARELKRFINGGTLVAIERILGTLQKLALIHRATPPETAQPGHHYVLPVSSLHHVIGIYPAGLGRSYTELARLLPSFGPRAVIIAKELHTAGITTSQGSTPMDAALLLQHRSEQAESVAALLRGAPERTQELLARFGDWAMGAVPRAQRTVSLAHPHTLEGPVDWLLAHGLLVPLDAEHVELPRSVGLALRGGKIVENFLLEAPAPTLPATSVLRRRNAALGAIENTLRLCREALLLMDKQTLATLRSGGVGVREMKRIVDGLGTEFSEAAFVVELCAAAGLIRLDVDTSTWVPDASEWLGLPHQEQWMWLVTAWLTNERASSLVGQPVPGGRGSSASGGNAVVNVLSAEAHRADAPAIRARVLELLLELTAESTSAEAGTVDPATAPVIDAAAILERSQFSQPRLSRRFSKLVPGILEEAAALGLMGSGALTPLGAAVASGQADAAADAVDTLSEHLPAPVEHILLQGDMTAVAPGYLTPQLSERLRQMTDPEGQGPASTYRFSTESIRRALDAGDDAASLLEFLAQHSATDIPQPLRYLIEDTASRHGQLRIGHHSSIISSNDEQALTQLMNEPRLQHLGLSRLAPTVITSTAAPRVLAASLREMGLSPTLDPEPTAAARNRPFQTSASRMPSYTAPSGVPDTADVEAQVALLRGHRLHSPANTPPSAAAMAPELSLEILHQAIRLKVMVSMNIVDSTGNSRVEILLPVSISGGRVRVFDPAKETERVLSIHRVVDVELLEEK